MRVLVFAVIALTSCAYGSTMAESQPPPPKLTEATEGQSPKTTDSGPPAEAPEKPSQIPPITVVVQPPPEDPAAKARQEQRDERNIAAQERIADLTKFLTALAGATLLFIGWQAWETRRSVNAAAISAQAAVDVVNLQKLSNQQWLEGEWTIEEDKNGVEREVQVGLMIKNPTQMSLELKELTVDAGSRASRAPGFSITNMLDITGPGPIGPNGSFFATLIKLPWMTDDNDRGAFITARVTFIDAYGAESTTSFVTTALWVGGRAKLSGGHSRTVRNTDKKEQGQPRQQDRP